jgi:type I restriction enzyme S subunit
VRAPLAGWAPRRLGEFLKVKHGFAFKGEHFSDEGRYIVVTPGNFQECGGFKAKSGSEKYYTAEPPPDFVLRRGALIVAMTEQSEGLLGSSAVVPVDGVYLHNQRIGLVSISDSSLIDLGFLYYLFNTRPVRAQLQATATGSKVRHTAPARIEAVDALVPPLPVQRQIASVLRTYDELIENNARRIQILEEMAQAIYREWFVEFRYPGHEDVPLVDSALGPIPEGWEVRSLGDLVTMHRENADPRKAPQELFAHFSLPAFDAEHQPVVELGSGIKSLKYGLPGPCILYSKLNPRIPRVWWADPPEGIRSIASTEFLVLTPRPNAPRSLVFAICSSPEFADRVVGMAAGTSTSHQRAKPQELLKLAAPGAPRELYDSYDALAGPMLCLAASLRDSASNLRTTRDLLLPRLISGEIDVSDLDIEVGNEAA